MCELCTTDEAEKAKAVKRNEFIADQLLILSNDYNAMARGVIKPHSDQAKQVGARAKLVISQLLNDWL